jgi:hypothetical protein
MRLLFSLTFLLLAIASYSQYDFDKSDFFEVGASIATFGSNEFDVFPSKKRGESVSRSNSLEGYGIAIRYGKGLSSFLHLTFGVAYSKREEVFIGDLVLQVERNFYSYSSKVRKLSSTVFEIGPRITFVKTDKIEISAGGGGFAKLTPKSQNDFLAGYYAHGIFGINFNQRLQLNVKYGFETTEGRQRNASFPAELAFNYKIY